MERLWNRILQLVLLLWNCGCFFDLAAKYGSSFNIILEFLQYLTSFHVLRERLDTLERLAGQGVFLISEVGTQWPGAGGLYARVLGGRRSVTLTQDINSRQMIHSL